MPQQLISIKEASELASKLVNREISTLNISYLVQYGKSLLAQALSTHNMIAAVLSSGDA